MNFTYYWSGLDISAAGRPTSHVEFSSAMCLPTYSCTSCGVIFKDDNPIIVKAVTQWRPYRAKRNILSPKQKKNCCGKMELFSRTV